MWENNGNNISPYNFDDGSAKLNLQMSLMSPLPARISPKQSVSFSPDKSPRFMSQSVGDNHNEGDIGDLSDIYDCNEVINDSNVLEDGDLHFDLGVPASPQDGNIVETELDVSELYGNNDNDEEDENGRCSNHSSKENSRDRADELFVDDNPALEALQMRQQSLEETGGTRSRNISPELSRFYRTPLSDHGLLSTSLNHEYLIGDLSPKRDLCESNDLKQALEAESDCEKTTNEEGDDESSTHSAKEASDNLHCQIESAYTLEDTELDHVGQSTLSASSTPSKGLDCLFPLEDVVKSSQNTFSLSSPNKNSNSTSKVQLLQPSLTPSSIASRMWESRNSSATKCKSPVNFPTTSRTSFSEYEGQEFDKENFLPGELSNEDSLNLKLFVNVGMIDLQKDTETIGNLAVSSVDTVELYSSNSSLSSKRDGARELSRCWSSRSLEYMPVERHYIDLHVDEDEIFQSDGDGEILRSDTCDIDSAVLFSDNVDNKGVEAAVVRRPSINKVIEIELQNYVHLHKQSEDCKPPLPHQKAMLSREPTPTPNLKQVRGRRSSSFSSGTRVTTSLSPPPVKRLHETNLLSKLKQIPPLNDPPKNNVSPIPTLATNGIALSSSPLKANSVRKASSTAVEKTKKELKSRKRV